MQTPREWIVTARLVRCLVVCPLTLLVCACAPGATRAHAPPTARPATETARVTGLTVLHADGSAITRSVKAGTKVRVVASIAFTWKRGTDPMDPHASVTVRQGQGTIGMTGLMLVSDSAYGGEGTADFQGTVPLFPARSGHVTLTVTVDAGGASARKSTTIPVLATTKAPRSFSLRLSISPSVIMHNSWTTLVVHSVPGAVCRAAVPEGTGYWRDMVGSRGRLAWKWNAMTIGHGTATVRCSYMHQSKSASASFTVV